MRGAVVLCLVACVCVQATSLAPGNSQKSMGFRSALAPEAVASTDSSMVKENTVPIPVLREQVESILSPPATGGNVVTASDVSEMFLTSRSDSKNKLMDSVKQAATQARSTSEAAQLMGLASPIGLDSSMDESLGMDGFSASNRGDFMSRVEQFDARLPTELTSPSGSKLSLTSFPQLLIQASSTNGIPPAADIQSGVGNVPQGLRRISQEFGSTISGMATHIGRLFGPSPSYNGPCQCRACMNTVHRLRYMLFDNTYHYGVQEIDEELNDRFCYGERWIYRSTCYNLVGKYKEMLKILVWLGTKEFDVCSFLFQCYPTSNV